MHTFFKDHLKHAEHAPEIITCMLSNEQSMRLIRFLMKIQKSERQNKKKFPAPKFSRLGLFKRKNN
jgi:hypothetical protein